MWAPLAINLEYISASIMDVVEEVIVINQEFNETPITKYLKEFEPDIFGVTMSATDHNTGLELCALAKKKRKNIPTMVGGYHPTAIPDELLSHKQVDMVFRGESEITMREFLEKGGPKGVAGISYKKGGKVVHNEDRPCVADLDTLPFPARHLRVGNECDLWTSRGDRHRDQIHTSRGCWGKCTFCCEPSMSRSRQRFRDPKKVMEEVRKVYDYHDREPVMMIWGDPHFMGRPRLVEELVDLLIEADLDVRFAAMLRADTVATHPKLVEKMVRAGIQGYCMGLEAPAEADLKITRKALSNRLQRKAVKLLRTNHAVAGGTFVIGLPSQSKEEIYTFPEFARNIGMTTAAFAVATPQAGSEFYKDLDSKGLIFERDWTKYDQMHLVFKHDSLKEDEMEELLTWCLGRFYALDIFLDEMIHSQFLFENGCKMTLWEATQHFLDRVNFVVSAGREYQPEDDAGPYYAKVFLKAQINPYTKIRTNKIGFHNVVDLTRMLRILGDQQVQVTLKQGGKPFVHYIFKSSPGKIEYIDITGTAQKGNTVKVALNLEEVSMLSEGRKGQLAARMMGRILRGSKFSTLVKGSWAILTSLLIQKLRSQSRGKGRNRKGKKIMLPKGFMDDFAAADGWDPKKFAEIRKRNQ